MKPFLLNKVCLALSQNCKNKVINLTFFETPYNVKFPNSLTREEFDRRLPDIYYILHIGIIKDRYYNMERDGTEFAICPAPVIAAAYFIILFFMEGGLKI